MVRFVQTSDWQIGMKGGGLGEAGPIVREIRIESIHNVLKSAQEQKVDFALLCGDIFEHNMVSQEDVKRVVTTFNQYPDIPIYLLPGNHDMLGADCVYSRPIFQRVNHLTILSTSDSVKVAGAMLHPCPIPSRLATHDLTGTIPVVREVDGIHIGVAHGSLIGKSPVPSWEDVDLPIDPACVDRTGIDYLALGHWHGHTTFEDSTGTARIAYSGTHEQTKYDEANAGHCLLIQIDGKGEAPRIVPIRTGQLTWVSAEFEMRDPSSLIELEKYFESVRGFEMVRLILFGEFPLESKEELDNLLEFQTTVHRNLRVESDSLNITVPPSLEAPRDFGDPILNQTETHMEQLLANAIDPRERRMIIGALAHLQRLAKEVEG